MSVDVLLIQPPTLRIKRFGFNLESGVPPLTLLYLAKPLREKGFSVDLLDLNTYFLNARRFKEYIANCRPALVGISCSTLTFREALHAAEYIKSVDPGIIVVFGGPHVTFTVPETLANDCIDIVVRGEGDVNFPQLVEHYLRGAYSLSEIAGISYRQNGEITETPRKVITDIDVLSFPRRDLLDLTRYTIPGTIIISRGCPCRCRFCASAAMTGGKYKIRGIDNILQEIDYLVMECGLSHLAFLDDTMTAYPETTKALCRYILEKGYALRWLCESRVDVVDEGLIRLMAQAGCYGIQYGFESGSEEVLKTIGKGITPGQIDRATAISIEAGILPMGNFLIGFPEDTAETISETIRLGKLLKCRGCNVNFGVVTPFPGTYYYNHARELGITIHAESWDDYEIGHPIISTAKFTREELRTILFDSWMELGAAIP